MFGAVLSVLSGFCSHVVGEKRTGWFAFLLVFGAFSLRCRGLVCGVWLYLFMAFSSHTHFFLDNTHYGCNIDNIFLY